MTRRNWIALAFLCIIVGGIVLYRHRTRPPKYFGFIDGVVAVDARSAVIVWRTNDDGPSRSWVSRIDDHGEPQWVQPIPALAMSVGGSGPVTIVDGVAVVCYGHRGAYSAAIDNSAIAFDLTDGHVLWDHVLSSYTPFEYEPGHKTELQALPLYISDLAVGNNVVSFADAGDIQSEVATSTNARSGAVGWSHAVPQERAPVVFGESYATHDARSTLITDVRSGDARE